MIAEDFCPDCGSKQPANTPAGLCPQCLLRLGLGLDLDLPMGSGVLTTLDESIGPVPRVLLRDVPTDGQLIRPRSPEMPDLSGHPSRYHLMGEVARGGMGAVLKGRTLTWAGTLPSR